MLWGWVKEDIMKKLLQALTVGLVFLVLCGFLYPFLVLGVGQLAFPGQANGSMVSEDGKVIGSALIGQNFTDARFFHGRVSAVNYNTFPAGTPPEKMIPGSGSDNYSVSNPALKKRIQADVDAFLRENPSVSKTDLPADLFTSSYSGLDPDISPEAAQVQTERVAKASGISRDRIEQVIRDNTAGRALGIFGEPRVNVLKANLEIDRLLRRK